MNKPLHGEDALLAKLKMPTLLLGLSSYCNLKCPYCSIRHRRLSAFSDDVFSADAFMERLETFPPTHFFVSGGEPLIHKNLWHFMEFAAKHKHIVTFDTNGTIAPHYLSRLLDAFPPELFGVFNISHHMLAGVSLETVQQTAAILRRAAIPHFVKYIGTPEHIPLIRKNMRILREQGTGVCLSILASFQETWNGRYFPEEYTWNELISLLQMVTLCTHGLQFFGGIHSQGHPCLAGSTFAAYNLQPAHTLISCCHGSAEIPWASTVFGGAAPQPAPCRYRVCLGDHMFIVGLQGFADEQRRFAAVCLGDSPPVGLEAVLAAVKAIAGRRPLVHQERFDQLYAMVMGA